MKNISKKKLISILVLLICILFTTQVQAFNPTHYKPDSLNTVSDGEQLAKIGNEIVGVIQVIGSAISVIALVVIGIKYIMGSVEERAEYKKTLMPYLIGAIMLFGITNILAIVQGIISGL